MAWNVVRGVVVGVAGVAVVAVGGGCGELMGRRCGRWRCVCFEPVVACVDATAAFVAPAVACVGQSEVCVEPS